MSKCKSSAVFYDDLVRDLVASVETPLCFPHYNMLGIFESVQASACDVERRGLIARMEPDCEVVPIESPDCPSHYFEMFTGNYYTSDIVEVLPGGGYIWRGRDDDFIKTSTMKGVDGKSIQDEVYRTCSDLVSACVVVGHGRPSAAILVEPSLAYLDSAQWDAMKKEIICRLGPSMKRRYSHERITDPKLVAVLSPESLPRTVAKGNIKRRIAEEQYKGLLDNMYDL